MSYTLGTAAKAVGKSKATISKAIKNGRLSATKHDNGSYSIEAVELHRVYPPTPSEAVASEPSDTPKETPTEIMLLQAALAAEREKNEILQRHLDDVRRMLPPPDTKPRRRWWPW